MSWPLAKRGSPCVGPAVMACSARAWPVLRAVGRGVFCAPYFSHTHTHTPRLTRCLPQLLPNTYPGIPHEKGDEAASRDTQCLGLHQHLVLHSELMGDRSPGGQMNWGWKEGSSPRQLQEQPPHPAPPAPGSGGGWGTRWPSLATAGLGPACPQDTPGPGRGLRSRVQAGQFFCKPPGFTLPPPAGHPAPAT